MDFKDIFTNANQENIMLMIRVDDLKEAVSYLFNEERKRQEKIKENENDGLIDSKQAKEMLNVKTGTLWRWNNSKYLCAVKIGNRNYYRLNDVKRILQKNSDEDVS